MSRSATAAHPQGGGSSAARGGESLLASYWARSALPFISLIFVLPLVAVYEVGTRFPAETLSPGVPQEIIAFLLLRQFFGFFGIHGHHLPALAVVGILVAWHIARKDPWTVRLETLFTMAMESIFLAMPVMAIGFALSHYFPLISATGRPTDFLVLSLGAGVYEELVFRLMLFSAVSLIFHDALQVRPGWVNVLMVVGSGILFSAYHYLSPHEHFRLDTCIFRTVAGIYFGVLFLARGFGITAGSHAAYDVIVVLLATAT